MDKMFETIVATSTEERIRSIKNLAVFQAINGQYLEEAKEKLAAVSGKNHPLSSTAAAAAAAEPVAHSDVLKDCQLLEACTDRVVLRELLHLSMGALTNLLIAIDEANLLPPTAAAAAAAAAGSRAGTIAETTLFKVRALLHEAKTLSDLGRAEEKKGSDKGT